MLLWKIRSKMVIVFQLLIILLSRLYLFSFFKPFLMRTNIKIFKILFFFFLIDGVNS